MKTKLRVGDIVRGVGFRYSFSSNKMKKGEIVEVKSDELVYVKVLEHETMKHLVGKIFAVASSDFEFVERQESIEIIRNGKKITATYYGKNGEIVEGIARCNPEDIFSFKYGSDLACERLFENIEKSKFQPYLTMLGENLGIVGQPVNIKDVTGQELRIGDVVRVISRQYGEFGKFPVVFDSESNSPKVMGCYTEKWNNGVSEHCIIIKTDSYTEIKDRQAVNSVSYILTPPSKQ